MKHHSRLPGLLLTCAGLAYLTACVSGQSLRGVEARQLFTQKIRPLLVEKCLGCHGNDPKKIRGGLDLRTQASTAKGGDSGPVLVSGRPEESPLFQAVKRQPGVAAMPPRENERLLPEQVEWVRQWIQAGAPWDESGKKGSWEVQYGVTVATSGGLSPEWTARKYRLEDLWAYRAVTRPTPPKKVIDPNRVATPIDVFWQAKLAQAGVTRLAPPAERATLIRRLTFDLTGLPPTPEEVTQFVQDSKPGAYDRLVERLLASPRYGEQQARHWLDVVRYADTAGFSNDFERPHAWRYRDHVVRAFQRDKPFDRFILEQLAGDELASNDPEALLAVGFLRMGPWEHTGMTVAAVTRQQWLDDVTHSVGVTFLGQGLRCAACHDHKFDPIPTRDYYRLQAAFAGTFLAERSVPFLPEENVRQEGPAKTLITARLRQVEAAQTQLQRKGAAALAAYLKDRGVSTIEELPAEQRPKRDYLGSVVGHDKVELTLRKVYQKSKQYFERELSRFEPFACSVYSGASNNYLSTRVINPLPTNRDERPPEVHILLGGALESPGPAVAPGVLSVVAGLRSGTSTAKKTSIPTGLQGRRLALARWIASPDNPLTARVLVNRIWQQHFGTGLVATPNNLGKMGARPSHPELLDWLATWFIENGWSLKKLHRLIATSQVYQQGGVHPDLKTLQRHDARNQLLAYFPARRLAAEEIRDALLAVTGELNLEAGGPGFGPEINWEVALQPRQVMGSVAPAYLPSLTPRERNRRTLYALRIRTLADPLLEVFNRPGSEVSCERRDETTVVSQAFALFNSAFTHQRALALAASVSKAAATTPERIDSMVRRVYGRAPTTEEQRLAQEHVARMLEHHRQQPPVKTALPTKVRRGLVEELVGELVTWEEELTPLRHYQPDLQSWQVDAEVRALAELALVLLNSNEFLHVR